RQGVGAAQEQRTALGGGQRGASKAVGEDVSAGQDRRLRRVVGEVGLRDRDRGGQTVGRRRTGKAQGRAVEHAAGRARTGVTGAERGGVRTRVVRVAALVAVGDVGEVVGALVDHDGATGQALEVELVGDEGQLGAAVLVHEQRRHVADVTAVVGAVPVTAGGGEVRPAILAGAGGAGVHVEAVPARGQAGDVGLDQDRVGGVVA